MSSSNDNNSPSAESPRAGSPAEAPKPETLAVRVKDQAGKDMTFKIKYTTKLEKVMAAFCKSIEVDPKTRRFHFEGTRVQKTDTPQSLEMQDDDLIDVFVEQQGGFR